MPALDAWAQAAADGLEPVDGVQPCAEFLRIAGLPRRTLDLTRDCLVPGNKPLFAFQRAALAELSDHRRLCVFANVGAGKLLVGVLSPYILQTSHNLFVTYAQLIDKTRREIEEASAHWPCRVSDFTFESAERLIRSGKLNQRWDLIVVDEAHLFRPGSGRSAALAKYLVKFPSTSVVLLTGTPGDDDIRKIAWLAQLAHGPAMSPYPVTTYALTSWHRALSEDVDDRLAPGALREFFSAEQREPSEENTIAELRTAVADHAAKTPGHVVYRPKDTIGASLYVRSHTLVRPRGQSKQLEAAYECARRHARLESYEFFDLPAERWRLLRQLGLGYAKIIDPRPPQEWAAARSLWAAVCHAYLGRDYVVPSQVEEACDRGELGPDAQKHLEYWRGIRPSFRPTHRVIWYDSAVVDFCLDWLKTTGGLVWTPYPIFGEILAHRAGVPFFHELGICSVHGSIERYSGRTGAVLAIQPNHVGRNLQDRWCQSLVLAPPAKSDVLNQLVGRTHRTGQRAESVEVTFLFSCAQHIEAVERARSRAEFDASSGSNLGNKLLTCDWLVDTARPMGPLWVSSN